MISEKTFAAQFSNFWRETLPNLELVTRSANLGYNRVSDPVRSRGAANRRDLISESGRRLFFKFMEGTGKDRYELLQEALIESYKYLNNIEGDVSDLDIYADGDDDFEIINLASWLARYFGHGAARKGITIPRFRGHGLISACSGDFQDGNVLVEMKYVSRGFRSQDIRQTIVYSALNYFENGKNFENIKLINPFLGLEFITNIDELVYSASGGTSLEFFQRLSYVASAGEVSH